MVAGAAADIWLWFSLLCHPGHQDHQLPMWRLSMRVYHLNDRNYLVKAVTDTHVLYDVVFTKPDATDRRDARDLGYTNDPAPDPMRDRVLPLGDMAVRLAQQGHFLRDNDRLVRPLLRAAGFSVQN
jgi:hypothetical protein